MIEVGKSNNNEIKWFIPCISLINKKLLSMMPEYIFRINGKIYTQDTKGFRDAIKKASQWGKLHDCKDTIKEIEE